MLETYQEALTITNRKQFEKSLSEFNSAMVNYFWESESKNALTWIRESLNYFSVVTTFVFRKEQIVARLKIDSVEGGLGTPGWSFLNLKVGNNSIGNPYYTTNDDTRLNSLYEKITGDTFESPNRLKGINY